VRHTHSTNPAPGFCNIVFGWARKSVASFILIGIVYVIRSLFLSLFFFCEKKEKQNFSISLFYVRLINVFARNMQKMNDFNPSFPIFLQVGRTLPILIVTIINWWPLSNHFSKQYVYGGESLRNSWNIWNNVRSLFGWMLLTTSNYTLSVYDRLYTSTPRKLIPKIKKYTQLEIEIME